MNNTKYTFGTTQAAAKRLEEMGKFFNPIAAEWIQKYPFKRDGLAADVGCGPGFTTEMLFNAVKPSVIFGIDKSEEYIRIAKEKYPGYMFLKHDVSAGQLPCKADVIYCRFLLSHLPGAEEVINGWTNSLMPGGMLFIDETEEVVTDIPVFRRYLEINKGLVGSQGSSLYIGEALARGEYKTEVLSNELARIPVSSWRAASWFYPNTVSVWEKEKYVLDNIPRGDRQMISEEIRHIFDTRDASVKSIWDMRRIVLKKND
jgi:SAM-dependent methyltransferase